MGIKQLNGLARAKTHLVQLVGAGVDNLVVWQPHFRSRYLISLVQDILRLHSFTSDTAAGLRPPMATRK